MTGQLSLDLGPIPVVEAHHRDRKPRQAVYYRPMRMGADRALEYARAITPDLGVDPGLWVFDTARNPGRGRRGVLSDPWRRVATVAAGAVWL